MMESPTFSSGYDNSTWSYENDSSDVYCVSRHEPLFLVFCAFPSLSVLINVFVLVAVLRKAQNLMRQSHVYAHVSSTLIGNVWFSVLALIQVLSLYFNFGGFPDDPDLLKRGVVNESAALWWPFHKAFLCGMFVIMCGNITLMIGSIRHNTCSTLKTAAGRRIQGRESGKKWKKRLMTRRQRSFFAIALLWIVPMIYVAIPPAGWNCADTCQCLSECFPSNHSFIPSDFTCSKVFPPMKNAWVSFIVISWLFGVVITIWLLKRSLHQVTKMWSHSSIEKNYDKKLDANEKDSNDSERKRFVPLEKNSESSATDFLSLKSGVDQIAVEDKAGDPGHSTLEDKQCAVRKTKSLCFENHGKPNSSSNKNSLQKTSVAHRSMREHLRYTKASTSRFRYVIYLTVFFVLCTAPTMIILCIDILNPTFKLNMVVLNSCLMCPFVYCYLCPFILVKCLPGMKTSLSALILSVYSTSK